MFNDHLTYAGHEADLEKRFPAGLSVEDIAGPYDCKTWAPNAPYSYYLSQKPREPKASPRSMSKKSSWEARPLSSNPKPARLKKRRTFTDERKTAPSGPHTSPRPLTYVESVQRPLSSTEYASTSASASRQSVLLPNLQTRSMWWSGRRVHPLDQTASKNEDGPPNVNTTQFEPTNEVPSSSIVTHYTSRTPSSPTWIDEQEFFQVTDTLYPSHLTAVQTPRPRSRHASVATSLSVYSQVSYPHDLQMQSTPTTLAATEVQDPQGEDTFEVHEQWTDLYGDQQSTQSVHTIHTLNPRRMSTNTLAGWVEYVSETQSLHTVSGDSSFPRWSTPTEGGSTSSTLARPTPPTTLTTLVAGSRISITSREPRLEKTIQCCPSKATLTSINPDQPNSSIQRSSICLDYDYGVAIDVLVYGIKSMQPPDLTHPHPDQDFPRSPDDGCEGWTLQPAADNPQRGSRRTWVGIPVSARRGKKSSITSSAIVEQELEEKPRSIFSRVTHLFVRT